MRRNRFAIYLLLQLLVILAVTLIFRFSEDKKTASVQAGFLFVLLPIFLLNFEVLRYGFLSKLWLAGVMQFWLFFALPILSLRLLHWEDDFANLSMMGVSGPTLHFWSSKSYLLMMLITLWNAWRSHKNKKPV